jgi:hypothetical protein
MLSEVEKTKLQNEKAKAKAKEKALKEKEKAKALKEKEKEKAKALKEKEKAKALKEKEKAKALKEKEKAKALKQKEKEKALKKKEKVAKSKLAKKGGGVFGNVGKVANDFFTNIDTLTDAIIDELKKENGEPGEPGENVQKTVRAVLIDYRNGNNEESFKQKTFVDSIGQTKLQEIIECMLYVLLREIIDNMSSDLSYREDIDRGRGFIQDELNGYTLDSIEPFLRLPEIKKDIIERFSQNFPFIYDAREKPENFGIRNLFYHEQIIINRILLGITIGDFAMFMDEIIAIEDIKTVKIFGRVKLRTKHGLATPSNNGIIIGTEDRVSPLFVNDSEMETDVNKYPQFYIQEGCLQSINYKQICRVLRTLKKFYTLIDNYINNYNVSNKFIVKDIPLQHHYYITGKTVDQIDKLFKNISHFVDIYIKWHKYPNRSAEDSYPSARTPRPFIC